MSKIFVWSGHHSQEIYDLVLQVYRSKDDLLLLCPPRITDISAWISLLPSGEIIFCGEFTHPSIHHVSSNKYPVPPKFGLFSTGTENGTKIILYTNENLNASLKGIFSFFKNLKITTIFSYPQPYHIFGLVLGYVASIVFDIELFPLTGKYSQDDHQHWLSCAKDEGKGLLTLGTPTHFRDLLKSTEAYRLKPSSSLSAIVGGARVDSSLWKLLKNDLFIKYPSIGYGASEFSPGVTHLPPGLPPENEGDLGEVLPNGELFLKGDKYFYRGENVCLAILQNKKIFFPEGEYLISDELEIGSNGHYFYKGRAGLILNRGGEKFLLEEIEQNLGKLLNISCVAIAVKDERLGEELVVVYRGREEDKSSISGTLNSIYKRSFSADNLIPVEVLPVNSNAKFDRHECLSIYKSRTGQ